MPWMTGLQVMHSARTAGLPVPVVVMTGMTQAEVAGQVHSLGERARLIRKPFSLQELMAAVGEVIVHAA
jgi:FixJ family two-component response regulator